MGDKENQGRKSKKGAKSKSGREPGMEQSASSQWTIKNYFSSGERQVEVGTPMGLGKMDTNTS